MGSNITGLTVNNVTSTNDATADGHCPRLDQVEDLIAASDPKAHTHTASQVTDFGTSFNSALTGALVNSTSISWTGYAPSVIISETSGLTIGVDGLAVDFGEGYNQVARGCHTHEAIDWSTLDGNSIVFTFAESVLTAEVIPLADGGLVVSSGGLGVNFGTSATQVAVGNHTHAQLHDAATVLDSSTIAFTLTGQQVSAAVKLAAASTGYAALNATSTGLRVQMDATGQPASYGHTHDAATQYQSGFMSAADKRKLDQFVALQQAGTIVPFFKSDALMKDAFVGGMAQWPQDMILLGADLTCDAPQAATSLSIQTDGTDAETGLTIPTGTEGTEATATWTFTGLYVEAGKYVRVKCATGVEDAEDIADAPSGISFNLIVQPAIGSIPTLLLNCGGDAVADTSWAEDDCYDLGSEGVTTQLIEMGGVSSHAPQIVYQTWRGKYYDVQPLTYTITGLAKGIDYTVRLHFCECYWNAIGDNVFDVSVIGLTTDGTSSYDPLSNGGGKFFADNLDYTMRADANGQIQIKLTPVVANNGYYNCSINGIEIIYGT